MDVRIYSQPFPSVKEKKGGIPTLSRPYKILIILDIN
jgi:hypothetical protein